MRRLAALGLVLAPALSGPAHAADPPPAVPLDRGWTYAPDPEARDDPPVRGWQRVALPHLFDQRPTEERFGGQVGWYRLRFDRPPSERRFGWAARFGGVRREARVRLNGRELARHADPYVPFTVPLDGLRARGNVLEVRVDSRKGAEPREGWWNWGGLARPVRLEPLGRLVLDDAALLSDLTCDGPGVCAGGFVLDTTVHSEAPGRLPGRVRVTVTAPDGEERVQGETAVRPLAGGETARVRIRLPLRAPQLWSPAAPQLYDARVEAVAGGRVEDVERLRPGLRDVAVRDGLLELNGRPLQLRGASIQEDLPGRGAALRDVDVQRIVRDLQAVGADVTRAHYLLDERLLSALDRTGILVWSQAPVYHRDALLQTSKGREEALGTLRDTVRAARRHPSVLTHSVANELSPTPDAAVAGWLEGARETVASLDPSVPASIDLLSYPGVPAQPAYAAFDLLGINSYFGWYQGKRDRSTERLDDLGPFLDRARRLYPRQALALTEFGAESTFHGPAQVKETFAFQDRYVAAVLREADSRPWLSAAIHWTLREFAVKPDWDGGALREGVPRDGIHNKGLLTYDGRPKPAWRTARTEFTSRPWARVLPGAEPVPPGPDPWAVVVLVALLTLVGALAGMAGLALRRLLGRAPALVPVAGRPVLRALPGSTAPSGAQPGGPGPPGRAGRPRRPSGVSAPAESQPRRAGRGG